MRNVYHLCDTCAYAVLNDDLTSWDLEVESLEAFMESVGYLVDAGQVSKPGYWSCEACSHDQIGSAHALETV